MPPPSLPPSLKTVTRLTTIQCLISCRSNDADVKWSVHMMYNCGWNSIVICSVVGVWVCMRAELSELVVVSLPMTSYHQLTGTWSTHYSFAHVTHPMLIYFSCQHNMYSTLMSLWWWWCHSHVTTWRALFVVIVIGIKSHNWYNNHSWFTH